MLYTINFFFNLSVATGTFPTKLKNAVITPIYKSGPNDDPKNYRPISQMTVFFLKYMNLQ